MTGFSQDAGIKGLKKRIREKMKGVEDKEDIELYEMMIHICSALQGVNSAVDRLTTRVVELSRAEKNASR